MSARARAVARFVLLMMWRANKPFILMLLAGLLLLAGAYFYLLPQDPLLAERVAGTGFCVLLFVVALLAFLSVRRIG